jgi:hypothetical protein
MAVTETGNTGQVEGTTFGTGTVTCSLNTSAGNGVILVVAWYTGGGATVTVTENQSNPAPVQLIAKAATNETIRIYFWKNLTTGATGHQFSVTPSSNSFISLSAIEVTGQDTATQAGATNSGSGTAGTTTPSAGAITPASGSLAVCGLTHDNSTAPALTAGTGWTRRGNIPGVTGICVGSETRAGAGSSVSGDWTTAANILNWGAVVAEIQAAAGGGGGGKIPPHLLFQDAA